MKSMITMMSLNKLPNMSKVGGNRRPGHWAQRQRWFREEKEDWIAAIREKYADLPLFVGKVSMFVGVAFLRERRRDEDNIIASLKPLLDALVHVGVVEDDSQFSVSLVRHRDFPTPEGCTNIMFQGVTKNG